jgi:hypothetical protein
MGCFHSKIDKGETMTLPLVRVPLYGTNPVNTLSRQRRAYQDRPLPPLPPLPSQHHRRPETVRTRQQGVSRSDSYAFRPLHEIPRSPVQFQHQPSVARTPRRRAINAGVGIERIPGTGESPRPGLREEKPPFCRRMSKINNRVFAPVEVSSQI